MDQGWPVYSTNNPENVFVSANFQNIKEWEREQEKKEKKRKNSV